MIALFTSCTQKEAYISFLKNNGYQIIVGYIIYMLFLTSTVV